jgi:alkanesulfonate monooxygenase SsuD/methylene tetrahydromethanopterin reductase-like flavin-dependent oxidoreductase (luciferase family)
LFDLSVSSDGRDTPEQFFEKLEIAERWGARSLWLANHLFLRDPVSLAAVSLTRTSRIKVALMAVSPFTVHPVQAVMAAATLDEMFPGRVTLCFGVGAPADLKAVSIDGSKPLKMMREALKISRALLAGETVSYEGAHRSCGLRSRDARTRGSGSGRRFDQRGRVRAVCRADARSCQARRKRQASADARPDLFVD